VLQDTMYIVKIYGCIDKQMTKHGLHLTNTILCLTNLFY
jgi:hypothetical protein